MEPFETFEHAGQQVALHYDDDPQHCDPRDDYSNVGTMIVQWNRYDLGDEQEVPEPEGPCPDCDGTGFQPDAVSRDCERCEGYGEVRLPWAEFFRATRGARIVIPLYVYEHSGITIRTSSFGDPWDSGMAGFIFDTPEGVKECLGDDATDDDIRKALEQEVEIYAQYLEGEVYGYTVNGPDGEHDSCWGYLGDLDYVRSQAKEAAEAMAELQSREQAEVAYWAARDIATETNVGH